MGELVGVLAVGAFVEPQNGEVPIDADAVRANDNAVRVGFNSHDALDGIHFQGSVLAARPGAGIAGRKWFASDTKQIFRDTGSVWDEINYLNLTNGGTVAGAATFTGTLTSTSGSRTFGATTFSGTLTGTSASFSSSISAVGATLTGALSGTSATFTGSISAAGATFSGAVSFTGTVTFSGTIASAGFVSSTANPASQGVVRLANGEGIYARNGTNTADVRLISVQGSNIIFIGDGANPVSISGGGSGVNVCGSAAQVLSFFSAVGAAQQTVTGSRAGNAALASLLTKLASYGIIVDGSSA